MTWYYASGAERKGPYTEEQWERMVQEGVVTYATLVWHEGMADWQAYGDLMPSSSKPTLATPAPAPRTPSGTGGIVCSECGQVFGAGEVIRLGSSYVCAACKPRLVQKLKEGVPLSNEAEAIRQAHIKHEASVKSVGVLYYLGAAVVLLSAVFGLMAGARNASGSLPIMVVLLVLGILQVWVGTGLRGLKSWARIPASILSGIGLLGFPLGTLINAYILYLLLCEKGKTVFSDEYKEVIAATPHIKYKTSILVWIVFILLLALLGLGLFAALFAGFRR
jgi:DNA-directed RNA polymerase subunit RPC12/RpoP